MNNVIAFSVTVHLSEECHRITEVGHQGDFVGVLPEDELLPFS